MISRHPQFNTFSQLAAEADVLAMTARIDFDHETPIALADRFVDTPYFFVLESAMATPGNAARYSFMGFDPLWIWESRQQKVISGPAKCPQSRLLQGDPVQELKAEFKKIRFAVVNQTDLRSAEVAHFGGLVGYFGFDVIGRLEPTVGQPPTKNLDLPESLFYIPRNFFVVDQLTRSLSIIRHVWIDEDARQNLDLKFREETEGLNRLLHQLKGVHVPPPLEVDDQELDFSRFSSQMDKESFLQKATRSLEEIRNGEIFQIQIGNRLSMRTAARPFDIYRHLRMLNPSPYMFFYKFGHDHIFGASPEMMVNVAGSKVTHRPIAGTRRRTWNQERDALMQEELKSSEKERAEHIMLVDLSRNDIGRLAAPGKVEVEELMEVEGYSHVFHLVSQVSGKLAPEMDAFDAMAASFPNGTVCGAPKIRAIQLIYELEEVSREFYAGGLGIFDFAGNLKSTILIRTIHMRDQVASTQASAGIVYDSIPEHEWEETRNKMRACLIAIQNTLT